MANFKKLGGAYFLSESWFLRKHYFKNCYPKIRTKKFKIKKKLKGQVIRKRSAVSRIIIKFPIELSKYRNRTAKISADITILLFNAI